MRVFKNENNEITAYDESEIHLIESCGRSQFGTSELTSCYSQGCYSIDNSDSDFASDLAEAVAEKFDMELEGAEEQIRLYKDREDDFTDEQTQFVENWIDNNTAHEVRTAVWTGRQGDVLFIDDLEEITDDDEGRDIINDFQTAMFEQGKGGNTYTGKKYIFFESRWEGETAGYSVEAITLDKED